MRGKKARMLRQAAAQETGNDTEARKLYRKYKRYYTVLALSKSQNPHPLPQPHPRKSTATQAKPRQVSGPMIVMSPMKFIRERLKDESTTIGNLTGGRARHLRKAAQELTKTQLDFIALGGRLV